MKNFKNKSYFLHTGILLMLFGIVLHLSLPEGAVYGSNTDWLSQHAALAETIRNACLSEHTLLPPFLPLGGGSNGFLFSYYGYLRPDILLGCLFPGIPMYKILIFYMQSGYLASVLLFYWFLKKELTERKAADAYVLFGSILFLLASCFFHTHRQVMFINYMPFLLAALLCVRKKKYFGTVLFLVLAYCNSFYYTISILAALGWYWYEREGRRFWKSYMKVTIFSCGIAAALFLPTLLVILEHRRMGTSASDLTWFCKKMNSLLYTPYGMGLTVICFYLLLSGLFLSKYRKSSAFYLLISVCSVVAWIFNGTLYARAKILIPFVPLVVCHCLKVMKYYMEKKDEASSQDAPVAKSRVSLWLELVPDRKWLPLTPFFILVICLFYNRKSSCFAVMTVDIVLLAVWVCLNNLLRCRRKIRRKERGSSPDLSSRLHALERGIFTVSYLLLLVIPMYSFLRNAKTELWVIKEQLAAQQTDIKTEFPEHPLYRSEMLERPLDAANISTKQASNRASMYSSVTNPAYSDFFYDTLLTPIQINNRIALLPAKNPFFLQFMGVRYIRTQEKEVPAGYKIIGRHPDGSVTAENADVLPIAYVVQNAVSETYLKSLSDVEKLETLMTTTIVDDTDGTVALLENNKNCNYPVTPADASYTVFKNDRNCIIEPLPEGGYMVIAKKDVSVQLVTESNASQGTGNLLSFDVENKTGRAVVITINGMKNKLSGADAPYPNENTRFHYHLDSSDTLSVTLSKGHYLLKNIQLYSYDQKLLTQKNYFPVTPSKTEKNEILSCNLTAETDGYFVTSIPLQKGMRLWIDGEEQPLLRVNKVFAGSKIAKGEHEVTLTFTPPGYWLGIWISLGSFAVCICIMKKA